MVRLRSHRYSGHHPSYEVVADTAERAIAKAKRQSVRDGTPCELVLKLKYRGPAV